MAATLLCALAILLLIIDCLQTLDIKNHASLREINVILGSHPSDFRVLVYFAVCVGIAVALSIFLSGMLFAFAVALLVAVEIPVITNNHKLGLRIYK